MATVIGLDIGLQSIKVAIVEGSLKAPRVTAFHDCKLEGGEKTSALGPADLGDLVAQVFADRKIPEGQTVVASMPASGCLIREVSVPFTRPDQIRKTIKFQAESVFHAVSIDDLIVEYYKLSEQGEKSRVVVIGLKKDRLRERLEALEAADVDPAAVDLDAAALYTAVSLLPAARQGKRILAVDLGGGTMKMVALEGGRLLGLRSTRLQAAGIKVQQEKDRKRSRDLSRSGSREGLSLEELKKNLSDQEKADLFFAEPGGDEGRLPVVILDEEQTELFDLAEAPEAERQDVLEKVFLEIDRTLAATRLDGPLDQIYLTGGGAQTPGIEKAFTDHFGAPCERLTFQGAVPARLPREAQGALDLFGAVALGLALKGLGHDPAAIDFRKEEFQYQGKFEKAKRGVACALVLLFVLFFVIAYDYQMVEMERLLRMQENVKTYQRDIYLTLFPEDQGKPPEDFLAALKKKERDLKQRVKGFDVAVDVVSTLDMLRDIAQGFEEAGKGRILLRDLALKQRSSNMHLDLDNELLGFDLKNAVNGKPRLVALEEGRIDKDKKTDRISYEFRIQIRETEKKKPVAPAPRRAAEEEG